MNEYLVVALAGFLACMVDGSLGMGFGPTSSTILLGTGMSPVSVSATVNIAKVATGVVGGLSHWRFGNVDRRLAVRMAVPGMVGALVGVTVLRSVDASALRPLLATMLIVVAFRILFRFRRSNQAVQTQYSPEEVSLRGVGAAGFAGGVTNGLIGAWGPVVTPVLLHKGLTARYTVGSVNAAEVAVAVISVGSLFGAIQGGDVEVGILVAMLIGGVVAAPLAALLARRLPQQKMGIAVAGLLLFTNVRELAGWFGLGWSRWVAYGLVIVLMGLALSTGERFRMADFRLRRVESEARRGVEQSGSSSGS